MKLETKQEYYEYRGGWTFKDPPRLDPAIQRRLKEIDPALRLIWGGVAVVRDEPDGEPVAIRGPREATKVLFGRLTARYLDTRVRTFCGFRFKLAKSGREKIVPREDQIPRSKRRLARAVFEYVDYGRLRWILERHLTAEQLVAAGIYAADATNIPPAGDYIWRLDVQTPDGLYFEPDQDWLEMVAANNYETFHTPLKELYRQDHEQREAQETAREAEDEQRADRYGRAAVIEHSFAH
jgi:hypothetical protein